MGMPPMGISPIRSYIPISEGPLYKFDDIYERCIKHKECIPNTRFHQIDVRDTTKYIDYDGVVLKNFRDAIRMHMEASRIPERLKVSSEYMEKIFLPEHKNNYFINIYNILDVMAEGFGITLPTDINIKITRKIVSMDNLINMYDDIYNRTGVKIKKQMDAIKKIDSKNFKKTLEKLKLDLFAGAFCRYNNAYNAIIKLFNMSNKFKLYISSKNPEEINSLYNLMDRYVGDIKYFLIYFGLIFMDTYALGRMFRDFSHDPENIQPDPKNIIVFAGDAHARNYIKFIEKLDGATTVYSYLETIDGKTGKPNKCTEIDIESKDIINFNV